MWPFDKPFERHLKSLANNQRNIARAISRIITTEGKELNTLEEEARILLEGTRITTALYNNIELKKKNTEREKIHDSGNSVNISEEMRKILEEDKLLRDIINLNTTIYHEAASQMDLLKQTHQISTSLKDFYYQMAHYNQTITNQQSLLGVHHTLENIKNLSTQKLNLLNQIEQISADKEKRREVIIVKCKQLKMDDENIKKIAGQIITTDKNDRKITNQMSQVQFA